MGLNAFLFMNDFFGRYPDHRRTRCDVRKYNGICADCGATTNSNGTEDACACAYDYIVLDNRRARSTFSLSANDDVGRNNDVRSKACAFMNDDAKPLITERDVTSNPNRRWQ